MSTNDEYDRFLRRFNQTATHHEARLDTSRKLAGSFASLGLRTLSILNGGAIVAVPALAEVFEISNGAHGIVATSITAFAIGLVFAVIAILLAYISLEVDCSAIDHRSSASAKQVTLDFLRALPNADLDEDQRKDEIASETSRADRFYLATHMLQLIAISLAIGSLAAFIFGASNARSIFVSIEDATLEGVVTKVRDGDTIEIANIPIRISGISAPELAESLGDEAQQFMIKLVSSKKVMCKLNGERTYDRWVGFCSIDENDIGEAIVSAGLALDCPRYSKGRYLKYEVSSARKQITLPNYCK